MLFSSRLSLANLIELCRVLRHYLGSGLSLVDVFRQEARSGSVRLRGLAGRIGRSLEKGDDLEHALKQEQAAFPPLFLALASVGEETGNLPEVFRELEKYFLLQQRLRRQFLGMVAWPVLQFNAAVFVIAAMLWILGLIAESYGSGTKPIDPIGLGLTGTSGALLWLLAVYGTIAAAFVLYALVTRLLRQQATVDAVVLQLPIFGPCVRALALTRFCLGLRLTLETGMPIASALRLSLRATGNAAFTARTDTVVDAVRRGDDLTLALTRTGLFPEDFLHILSVGEESGRLTESLEHQTEHYEGEASRRLTYLTLFASFGVWMFTGALIVVAIFRIFMIYLDALNPANYGL